MDTILATKILKADTIGHQNLLFVSSNPLELSVFVDVYHIESPGNGS